MPNPKEEIIVKIIGIIGETTLSRFEIISSCDEKLSKTAHPIKRIMPKMDYLLIHSFMIM